MLHHVLSPILLRICQIPYDIFSSIEKMGGENLTSHAIDVLGVIKLKIYKTGVKVQKVNRHDTLSKTKIL